jgi:hypothetical protein
MLSLDTLSIVVQGVIMLSTVTLWQIVSFIMYYKYLETWLMPHFIVQAPVSSIRAKKVL